MLRISRMRMIASHPRLVGGLLARPRLCGYSMFAIPALTALLIINIQELIR